MFPIHRAGARTRAALGFLLFAGIAASASADVVTLNLAKTADAFNNYIDVSPFFAGGATQTEFWNVWIDFNSDGTFASSELVSSFSSFGSSTFNGFDVPGSLNPGLKTRMRIQMKRGSAPTSACETFANGEVEDHTVQIQ